MLNTTSMRKSLGFSLIELLIGMAVLGILMSIALPSFRAWILNSQIRNAAESIQMGLQRARAEAVLRNRNVEFVLNAANDSSWLVQLPTAPFSVIDQRSKNEGSEKVTLVTAPLGSFTVTFDTTGRPTANADASPQITSVALDIDPAIFASPESQDLQVNISFGGQIRMCDPHLPSTNVRGC